MSIDFHAPELRGTYASRDAQQDWTAANAPPCRSERNACGGCRLWRRHLRRVLVKARRGVCHRGDMSSVMLRDAAEKTKGHPQISFRQGDAAATGLPDHCADIVFERALIHHLSDRFGAFREAHRLLAPGGTLIVQDRTPEDIALPGGPEHLRGYFFQLLPRLPAAGPIRERDRWTIWCAHR